MYKTPEKGQPSPEEIRRAEESMTESQKNVSRRREHHENLWSPEAIEAGPGEKSAGPAIDYIGNPEFAKKRGEQIIQIELEKLELPAVKLEAVVQALIAKPSDALENSLYLIKRQFHQAIDNHLKTELIRKITGEHPEVVEASKTWQVNTSLLWAMFDSDGRGHFSRADLYDIAAARRAFRENLAIAKRFDFQSADFVQKEINRLIDLFESVGGDKLN